MNALTTHNQPRCWCFSRGLAGMLSNMTGLAEAVGIDYECKSTRLRLPWKVLPLDLIPRAATVITTPEILDEAPPPRLVLSCGRHGVIPALYLKQKLGDQVLVVQIQNPRLDPTQFDLVIAPRHDDVCGTNVIRTIGALHNITAEQLDRERQSDLARHINPTGQPLATVLIGGPTSMYRYSRDNIDLFIAKLNSICYKHDAKLAIIPSNRTPTAICRQLTTAFADEHFVWDRKSTNPYIAALAVAQHIIVTGDSVSMITEAASTGKPVFVEHPWSTRHDDRIGQFHEMLQQDGITRPFEGRLIEWTYDPPNDTPRVARIVRERMGLDEPLTRTAKHNTAA
tara:strand:+ start:703 stop:1722 length:1020 start_codon:yes stop_codon:yes gene_type:complete